MPLCQARCHDANNTAARRRLLLRRSAITTLTSILYRVVPRAKKVQVARHAPLTTRIFSHSGGNFCGQPAAMSACSRHANGKKRYKRATISQRTARPWQWPTDRSQRTAKPIELANHAVKTVPPHPPYVAAPSLMHGCEVHSKPYSCRIPDDHISNRLLKLNTAREVMGILLQLSRAPNP